jgi:hypothetical protein
MSAFFIKEPGAPLQVIPGELPSKDVIEQWIAYFEQPWPQGTDERLRLSRGNAAYVAKLLKYAWLGVQRRTKAVTLARDELAGMLASLARQIAVDKELDKPLEVVVPFSGERAKH